MKYDQIHAKQRVLQEGEWKDMMHRCKPTDTWSVNVFDQIHTFAALHVLHSGSYCPHIVYECHGPRSFDPKFWVFLYVDVIFVFWFMFKLIFLVLSVFFNA